ncbi:hypothetical protein GCM10007049_25600 [Echinicola pacifica]|uniref:Outer membrane protein beta-barrel domain-containing protein n=1 Tax=Echinicola pacifica TaxID=346377 RepID=A0A918Q5G8_9BACT|nr:hypothetical protein [Echinicola pacifica]GGZ31362.1 hypothetical protein GCM10007049_25600 [Echinicola pacifica]
MKKNYIVLLLLFLTISFSAYSQKPANQKNMAFAGLGAGLPYGGFGAQLSYNIENYFTVFGGLGYNLVGAAGNAGFELGIPSKRQTSLFVTGMYGYNAATIVEGKEIYNNTYNGPSFGAGVKINSLKTPALFWKISILVPSRSESYNDAIEAMKRDPSINIETTPPPVLFSVGLNYSISSL